MSSSEQNFASFDFKPRTRIIFGNDSLTRIGEVAWELGVKNILIVTDPGIVAAGHVERAKVFLEAEGLSVFFYDKVRENPTTRDIKACVEVAKEFSIDAFVGLGGGSSMDTAKGCNFILTNGGRMQDYWGVGKAKKPMLPMIAVPTTAGTGSECQSAALIANELSHQKMACLDSKAAPRVAILDPELTLSQPAAVTACTGIDAIAHAVETAVTTERNPMSQIFSREAFRLCAKAFPQVLENPKDLDARGRMQLGAALAGAAIENSMLGAAHAAANPLTAHFGIAHGQAVGMLLPHVVRFNSKDIATRKIYVDLALSAGLAKPSAGDSDIISTFIAQLETVLELTQMPRWLESCGIKKSKVNLLAQEAARQWTATFNPRRVSASDFAKIYEAAF